MECSEGVILLLVAALAIEQSLCQSACTVDGRLRLVGGTTQYEGRVEVCRSGQWGTICDDRWDALDTSVVCRQLQYSPNGGQALNGSSRFGAGTGSIHMDEVRCVGSESRLVDCSHTARHNCAHTEDVSVRCLPLAAGSLCINGDIRLQGGSRNNSGRVEVCKNDVWGTVCDDSWNNPDATVVCRQLGFSSRNAVAHVEAYFGAGTGLILMDDVFCTGTETRLVNCTHTPQHNCAHYEDASVTCNSIVCNSGAVRLIGGFSASGRVEICFNEVWGTVCNDYWDSRDTGVVCSQLGYSRQGTSSTSRLLLESIPIHMDDVSCRGIETRLDNCTYDRHTADCSHFKDVFVKCRVFSVHMSGAIVCIPWLSHSHEEKKAAILDIVADQLSKICSCPRSVNYIANSKLICGDSTTDRLILEGALVALPEATEIKLHKHLQDWVDTSPTMEVTGVLLKVVNCSTYPSEEDSCAFKEAATPNVNLITQNVVNNESESPLILYGGVGGAVLVVLLFPWITVAIVWGIRRRKRQTNRTNVDAADVCTGVIMESKVDGVKFKCSDGGSHIYECPEDLLSNEFSQSSTAPKGEVCSDYGKPVFSGVGLSSTKSDAQVEDQYIEMNSSAYK